MVTDPTTAGSISSQSRSAIFVNKVDSLTRLLPIMQVGDIVPLIVRQNYGNGQGLIAVQGQVVQASIPSNLRAGEKFFAQLTDAQDKVTLKILEGYQPIAARVAQAAQGATGSNAALLGITNQLEQIARESGALTLQTTKPFSLPDGLKQLVDANPQLAQLFSAIKSVEDLFDPQNAQAQLIAASNGSLSKALKETATSLRDLLIQAAEGNFRSFLLNTKESIASILKQIASDTSKTNNASNAISNLLDQISQRTKNPLTSEFEAKFLNQLYKDLYALRTRPDMMQAGLQNSLNGTSSLLQMMNKEIAERATKNLRGLPSPLSLSDGIPNQQNQTSSMPPPGTATDPQALDPKLLIHLREVATKLEQMSSTAETLNRLNPIMQAIGEPALVLFPFLFDGLLSQSEVALAAPKKQQHQNPDEEEGGKDEDSDSSTDSQAPFQQIHVNVPLPNMGLIDVMIAHRPEQIMVKFTTDQASVREFISARLEELSEILRSHGFEITELSTVVGEPKSATPEWCVTLRGGTSFVA